MNDPALRLRSATRRSKSDVANKMVSMFLHELSRKVSRDWPIKVDGEAYATIVRDIFQNCCPYCNCGLSSINSIVEHLDGMNRCRVGLHLPGNVLVACKRCNSEKRRDDSQRVLTLADSGWESFLSHDGSRCTERCFTCKYWSQVWENETERKTRLAQNLSVLCAFREKFPDLLATQSSLKKILPDLLGKLYTDCQVFADTEIRSMLERV